RGLLRLGARAPGRPGRGPRLAPPARDLRRRRRRRGPGDVRRAGRRLARAPRAGPQALAIRRAASRTAAGSKGVPTTSPTAKTPGRITPPGASTRKPRASRRRVAPAWAQSSYAGARGASTRRVSQTRSRLAPPVEATAPFTRPLPRTLTGSPSISVVPGRERA